jgi:hypothetical protein
MLTLIVGIVLGFVTCLYLIVVQQNKGNKNPSAALSGSSLYCNFIILDKSEAVKNAVEEKLQNKIGTGFLRDKLIQKVSQTASEKVSDEKIGEKILEKIIQEIPVKIHELGITAEATKVYCRESIFILKLSDFPPSILSHFTFSPSDRQLLSVDMQKLITKKAGEEKANKVEEMFKLLGGQVAKVLSLPPSPSLSSQLLGHCWVKAAPKDL